MLHDLSMRWPGIARAISTERLHPYLHRTQGDRDRALGIYLWNISLCESLYPLLNFTEVTLRNCLHQGLTDLFGRRDWFELEWLDLRDAARVSEAKLKISKRHGRASAGSVVAELSFGFWTSLLDVRYERTQILWPGLARKVFASAPRRLRTRKAQSRYATATRALRNRVFHHEPVWHWTHLPDVVNDATIWLGWLSPESVDLTAQIDRFREIFETGPETIRQKSAPLHLRKRG